MVHARAGEKVGTPDRCHQRRRASRGLRGLCLARRGLPAFGDIGATADVGGVQSAAELFQRDARQSGVQCGADVGGVSGDGDVQPAAGVPGETAGAAGGEHYAGGGRGGGGEPDVRRAAGRAAGAGAERGDGGGHGGGGGGGGGGAGGRAATAGAGGGGRG